MKAKTIDPAWRNVDGHHLERSFTFPDFAQGLAFVNRVGAIAEEIGHHPDVELVWGRVTLKLRTHDEHGISDKDVDLAARIDAETVHPASSVGL